jgi:hypothetical protein
VAAGQTLDYLDRQQMLTTYRRQHNDTRDLLPAPPLVDAWADRNRDHQDTLANLARVCGWDSDPERTLAVARSIYGHLPAGLAPFWSGTGHVDIPHARPALSSRSSEQPTAEPGQKA